MVESRIEPASNELAEYTRLGLAMCPTRTCPWPVIAALMFSTVMALFLFVPPATADQFQPWQVSDLGAVPFVSGNIQAPIQISEQTYTIDDNGTVGGLPPGSSGTPAALGSLPGFGESFPYEMNRAGVSVGFAQQTGQEGLANPDGLPVSQAVETAKGKVADLGALPGDTDSEAFAINSSGTVAGISAGNGRFHAVEFSKGQVVNLGVLAGDSSAQALALNSAGTAVGVSDHDGYHLHAVLFIKGTAVALDRLAANPSWTFETATGINDSNQIVGEAFHDGLQHGYLLTPPTSGPLLPSNGFAPNPDPPMPASAGGWPTVIGSPVNAYASIKLHYDYLVAPGPAGLTMAPDPVAVQAVANAFAAHGIYLQIDPQHNAIPMIPARPATDAPNPTVLSWRDPQVAAEGINGVNVFRLEQHYFGTPDPWGQSLADPTGGIHYALFGYYSGCLYDTYGTHCSNAPSSIYSGQPQAGQSGMASLDGGDIDNSLGERNARGLSYNLVVSLGHVLADFRVWRNPNRSIDIITADTLMHELGHNLGLRHGGCTLPLTAYSCTGQTFKPQYLSVMNYNYQLTGILHADSPGSTTVDPALTQVDYSEFTVPTIDEVYDGVSHFGLDETVGIPAPAGSTALFFYSDACGRSVIAALNTPVDYNCDGNVTDTNLQVDLNVADHPALAPFYSQLVGSDSDWSVIQRRITP
jgi:hypothetical protein